MIQFRADDRVLLLAIPPTTELTNIARVLMNGVLVGLGDNHEVRAACESMAGFENVMFIEAPPDRIPWRAAYFTKIIVPPQLEALLPHAAAELHRVLAPGGQIVRTTANV
ncbi:MAG: hypothetical protein ACR2IV_19930 [Bryobacteraceae bacterium]